ncbi:hypothetical protein CBM2633_A140087 [Cupriavidus taiwanensis]|nr:hypothetical protein CBM2633_A140087 [Cupriavidus taiwanensis]
MHAAVVSNVRCIRDSLRQTLHLIAESAVLRRNRPAVLWPHPHRLRRCATMLRRRANDNDDPAGDTL